MPKTITSLVYEFDELSDRAKDTARAWLREAFEPGDLSNVIEDAARMGDLLGITFTQRPVKLMNGSTRYEPAIYWSGFCSQGDGACFEGSYAYRKGSATAIAQEAPAAGSETNTELNRIAQGLTTLQRAHGYRLAAIVTQRNSPYSHEYSTEIEVSKGDEDVTGTEPAKALAELLRDFMRWIYRGLEAEYEYQQADEQIDETIRANEYTFDEAGERAG